MFKKGILSLTVAILSMPVMADLKSSNNTYFMTGATFSGEQERNFQGINLEYSWVDYNQHYTNGSHKHQLTGFGVKINTDNGKFDNQYSDVREIGVYGKRGFELMEEKNIYGLLSGGVGLVEVSGKEGGDPLASPQSSSIPVNGVDLGDPAVGDDDLTGGDPLDDGNDDGNGGNDEGGDSGNDNSITIPEGGSGNDEKISLSAEIGVGIGYYSRDGDYAVSAEILGQYYESGDDKVVPALRIMGGWRF